MLRITINKYSHKKIQHPYLYTPPSFTQPHHQLILLFSTLLLCFFCCSYMFKNTIFYISCFHFISIKFYNQT